MITNWKLGHSRPTQSNPVLYNPWMDPIHVQLWHTHTPRVKYRFTEHFPVKVRGNLGLGLGFVLDGNWPGLWCGLGRAGFCSRPFSPDCLKPGARRPRAQLDMDWIHTWIGFDWASKNGPMFNSGLQPIVGQNVSWSPVIFLPLVVHSISIKTALLSPVIQQPLIISHDAPSDVGEQ